LREKRLPPAKAGVSAQPTDEGMKDLSGSGGATPHPTPAFAGATFSRKGEKGWWLVEDLLPGEGARPKSHGETIAGLFGLLKDGAQRRRAAAARRAVLDQPEQPCTLQPPRDLRIAPDRWSVWRTVGDLSGTI